MSAFYNEWEKYPAEWLRNLSAANLIAPGVVDERSIKDVVAEDVRGATQAHWFAGLGVWSYALRLVGIPDDFKVWSASLPCQPFSQAGAGKGFDDERHLLPDFLRLVADCRPQLALGEQSASPDGLEWLDALQVGFKGLGYTVGFEVLASASVGAPHIRHRIYWVAYSKEFRWPEGWNGRPRTRLDEAWLEFERHGDARELADAVRAGWPERRPEPGSGPIAGSGGAGELADPYGERLEGERLQLRERGSQQDLPEAPRSGEVDGVVDSSGLRWRQDGLHASQGRGASREREAVEHRDAGAAHELADPIGSGCEAQRWGVPARQPYAGRGGEPFRLGDPDSDRAREHAGELPRDEVEHEVGPSQGDHAPLAAGPTRLLGDASGTRLLEQRGEPGVLRAASGRSEGQATVRAGSPTHGFWTDAEWRYCRDGKYRPTEPGVEPLAHGNSVFLDEMRATAERAWQEVLVFGYNTKRNSDEVLRMVQDAVRTETVQRRSLGRQGGVSPPPFLLDFLLCVEAARDFSPDCSSIPKTYSAAQDRFMRSMWFGDSRDRNSSCRRQSDEQRPFEPTESLHVLSLILAQHAEAYRQSALNAYAAANRVGRIKAYGNAINPLCAAVFIRAFMEATQHLCGAAAEQ